MKFQPKNTWKELNSLKGKEGSNGQNIFSKQAQLAKKGSQKSLI